MKTCIDIQLYAATHSLLNSAFVYICSPSLKIANYCTAAARPSFMMIIDHFQFLCIFSVAQLRCVSNAIYESTPCGLECSQNGSTNTRKTFSSKNGATINVRVSGAFRLHGF